MVSRSLARREKSPSPRVVDAVSPNLYTIAPEEDDKVVRGAFSPLRTAGRRAARAAGDHDPRTSRKIEIPGALARPRPSRFMRGWREKRRREHGQDDGDEDPSGALPVAFPSDAKMRPTSPRGTMPAPMKARRTFPTRRIRRRTCRGSRSSVSPSASRSDGRFPATKGLTKRDVHLGARRPRRRAARRRPQPASRPG